jgi:hypothetical protein
VTETIPALIESRYPRISELAAQTLALTENYRPLLRALQADHEETRLAALIGLSRWVRRAPENGDLLAEEVARVYPDDEVDPIIRLVWGYAPADARDPEISAQLVQWLRHPDIAIRQMAFFHILKLTRGEVTYRYLPDRSESQRESAIRQWENHINRVGALLPPEPSEEPQPAEAAPAL